MIASTHRPLATALCCILLSLGGPALAQSSAQVLHTRALAATCANCHGTEGRAVEGQAMVRLAGMNKDTMVTQLRAFRDGTRTATVMHQLTKGYTDQQIDSIAAYFAAQK